MVSVAGGVATTLTLIETVLVTTVISAADASGTMRGGRAMYRKRIESVEVVGDVVRTISSPSKK